MKVASLRPSSPDQEEIDPFENAFAQALQPRIEDVAVSFLLSDYIRSSHFRYLPELYATNETHGSLQPVVKAVALAGLAQHSGRQEFEAQARKYHVEAVATLKTFLECPENAVTDEVIATVLLLSLFETLTMHKIATLEAWEMHIRGALALLVMRGSKQFTSKFGIDLFNQTSKVIKLFYLQHRRPMPVELQKLTAEAKTHIKPRTMVLLDYAHLIDGFMSLQSDIYHGDVTDPYEIITRSDDLLQLSTVAEASVMPCREQFSHLSARTKYYKLYSTQKPQLNWDPYAHQAWQNLWMARVELNSNVCNQYALIEAMTSTVDPAIGPGPGSSIEAFEHCQAAIEAAENIYAAVDQFFPDDCIPNLAQQRAPDPAAGYFAIWPLHTAGRCRYVDSGFRNKVVAKLHYIAAVMNLPQANSAAEHLELGVSPENWMHIYHVF